MMLDLHISRIAALHREFPMNISDSNDPQSRSLALTRCLERSLQKIASQNPPCLDSQHPELLFQPELNPDSASSSDWRASPTLLFSKLPMNV